MRRRPVAPAGGKSKQGNKYGGHKNLFHGAPLPEFFAPVI
jgi:hypothetical protein